MQRRRRSTRARLTLTYTAAFGAAMLVVSTLAWLALSTQAMSQLDVALTSELQPARAQLSAYIATASEHKDPPRTGTSLSTLVHSGTAVNVIAWSGNHFIASSSGADGSQTSRQWAIANDPGTGGDPNIVSSRLDGGVRALVAHLQTRSYSATLLLTTSLNPYTRELWQSALTLSLAVLLLTALAALVSYRVAAAALRPIHRLTTRARQVTEHNIDEPLLAEAPQDDEVGELAATLESMRIRLATSFDDQRRLRADTAHELRTPLAMLQAEIEVTLGKNRSVEEYRTSLHSLLGDVDHLNQIVSRLLLVSRAEADVLKPPQTVIDMASLVDQSVQRAARLRPREIAVGVVRPASMHPFIAGDHTMLRQALDNVLANAIQHATAEVIVTIAEESAAQGPPHLVVTIDDDGPGIPVALRPDVLKPFRRLDSGRSRDDGGAGLGLAVTDAIIRTHKGTIRIGDSPAGGAAVSMAFPIVVDHDSPAGDNIELVSVPQEQRPDSLKNRLRTMQS